MYADEAAFTAFLGGPLRLAALMPLNEAAGITSGDRSARIATALLGGEASVNGVLAAAGYVAPVVVADHVATAFQAEVAALLTLRVCQLALGQISAGIPNPSETVTAQAAEARTWLAAIRKNQEDVNGLAKVSPSAPAMFKALFLASPISPMPGPDEHALQRNRNRF